MIVLLFLVVPERVKQNEEITVDCSSGATVVDRCVTYNYLDSRPNRPVWTTGTLARGSWQDSSVFGLPHATYFNADDNASFDVVGNTEGSTIYFEHEKGTDEALAGSINTIKVKLNLASDLVFIVLSVWSCTIN